jgi:Skp family chaperone for outer membrane proteins
MAPSPYTRAAFHGLSYPNPDMDVVLRANSEAFEEKYKPILEENQAIKREIKELREKLRQAGING